METTIQQLGPVLKKARKAQGLSVQDLILKLHDVGISISDGTLYALEAGEPLRQLKWLETLCRVLGVKWVLGENGSGQTKKGVHDEVSRRGRNAVARVAG